MWPNSTLAVFVDQAPGYGRILRASRAFKRGEVVLAEKPLFVSVPEESLSQQEWRQIESFRESSGLDVSEDYRFLKNFCLASDEIRISALDCFAPSVEAARTSPLLRELLLIVPFVSSLPWAKAIPAEILEQALLVKYTNAHEIFASGNRDCALYKLGSKIRHSCDPNVVYTSRREAGLGCFVAVREISDQEEITYSYIDVHANTKMRQAALQANYLFLCDCRKCHTGRDDWAGMKCGACAAGFTFFDQASRKWECGNCGNSDTPEIDQKHKVEQRVQVALRFKDCQKIEAEITKLRNWLHADHALVRVLEKRYLEVLLRDPRTKIDQIAKTTDSLLAWTHNDVGFLDSTLVRVACVLGRAGNFQKALYYLALVEDDQRLIFTETSEPLQLTLRAKKACSRKRAQEVPELADSDDEAENQPQCAVM